MMRKMRHILILAATALVLAACTQDEPGGQGNELPYGEYPLQIGGVTLNVECSAEPWSAKGLQTRVAEDNTDGKSSVWQWDGSEMIGVRLGNETATYTLNADKTLTTDQQLYWTSTESATVTAWYPTDETVGLSDQSKGLAYVLKAEVLGATYNNEIALDFKHQLAKVRVALADERVSQVTKVEVYGYTSCTNTQGTVTTDGASQGWITMHNPTEYGDGMYWEANLVPCEIGDQNTQPFVRLNGTTEVPISTLTELKAGNLHTVTVDVRAYPSDATQITAENAGNISGKGNYYVTGNLTSAINITGGSPHIYLYNANVTNSTGNAISITGGNPTIHVKGDNNTVKCTSTTRNNPGAGIYVVQGSTVTITGSGRNDKLTTNGAQGGAGIGGNNQSCGNIAISNVTVYAYGSTTFVGDVYAAGIGGSGKNTCGTISIDNATIFAYGASDGTAGNMSTPGIGGGLHGESKGTYSTITIKNNSQVSVQRGSNRSDYVGSAGTTMNRANSPNGIDATVDETCTITKLN